jgi:Ca2+-binding RTX toxin-like protein
MGTITVTTLSDSAAHSGVSLRDALTLANSNSGTDMIVFATGLSGSIRLQQGQLTISSDLSIDGDTNGDNRADITISGEGSSRILNVVAGTSSINALILRDGVSNRGGAVFIDRGVNLTIDHSTVSANRTIAGAAESSRGGGISSHGNLKILNSAIENNFAYDHGGGVDNNGTLTAINSTFDGNSTRGYGGGILSDGGMFVATNIIVSGNTAAYGGGIDNETAFTATNITVTGNFSGPYGSGIFNTALAGQFKLSNSVILGNGGSTGTDVELFGTPVTSGLNIIGISSDRDGSDGIISVSSVAEGLGGNLGASGSGVSNHETPSPQPDPNPPAEPEHVIPVHVVPVHVNPVHVNRVHVISGSGHTEEILGTGSNDRIHAFGGNDVVRGKGGNDRIFGDRGRDHISGGGGGDGISGGNGRDSLSGNSGNDKLSGGRQNDRLTGGSGSDKFVFGDLTSTDRVMDFHPGSDSILLSHNTFTGLGMGQLDASDFVSGSTSNGSGSCIVYNPRTGSLSFDSDGTGGHDAFTFAKLSIGLHLAADDIIVI